MFIYIYYFIISHISNIDVLICEIMMYRNYYNLLYIVMFYAIYWCEPLVFLWYFRVRTNRFALTLDDFHIQIISFTIKT